MPRTILILSGPTHEYIDPVRFIGNASSGLMGKAIAEEAAARGYRVRFITGPVANSNLPELGCNGEIVQVVSADEMLRCATTLFPTSDAAVFSAAVADYAPVEKQAEKMAKSEKELVLRLRPTPDISKMLCKTKRNDQVAIGFALQTTDGEIHARRKLEKKNLDGIVLNSPATLGASDGTFSFISKSSATFSNWGKIDKIECAKRILNELETLIRGI